MTEEQRRIAALKVGRRVLAALLQVVDADLALAAAHAAPSGPVAQPAENRTGKRGGGRPRNPNTICPACPACGASAYRNGIIGYRDDGKRIQKSRCDVCGHTAGDRLARPARRKPESKKARLARVVEIGERRKATRAARSAEVAA